MSSKPIHSFHIPVMGLAFTIDSPIRVAHYGIDSVISITDDELIEKMNAFYSAKFKIPYHEITNKIEDFRAKRITHYLNLVDGIVKEKFKNFKTELLESKTALEHYITMLPKQSEIKIGLQQLLDDGYAMKDIIKQYIEEHLSPGAIDVNIMTKVDKDNFNKNEQLPVEYNDAHAALRGFANSNLNSSLVLSAGMNPRLYSYIEQFKDFFPNADGNLKKKIILKVSDFRSAMIQGNFLAKKGLWVSEYRIESGLNCGGHAFATDGLLLGPILEEFKQKKQQLIQSAQELMEKALAQKEWSLPEKPLPLKITAQGGVGTADEHAFLLEQYALDSIGWGSPFLLVPQATSVDNETRSLLAKSKEDDFYLSHISPLGVPFNTVKGTTNEFLKQQRIDANKAGSSCPKKLLALGNKEYDSKGMCTASKKYQDIKLEELDSKKDSLSASDYKKSHDKITEKSCLCVGLANASYLENNIKIKGQDQGIVICPGPNLAYFDHEISLSDMVRHIYGNANVMHHKDRPHVFINELKLYVDYLKRDLEDISDMTAAQIKKWQLFKTNLLEGIRYYQDLFSNTKYFKEDITLIHKQLLTYQEILKAITIPVLELA